MSRTLRSFLFKVFPALFVLALAGGVLVYKLALAPNTPDFSGERAVKIPPEGSLDTVVDSLSAAGVLASPRTFRWMARLTGWGDQVKAGHYTFKAGVSNRDLLTTLRRGLQTPVRLTIPSGTTPVVLAAVASREMAFSPAAFQAALADTLLAAELGTDTTHLAAFLLPDTYFFYWLTDPREVIRTVKQQFDRFYEKALAASPDPPDLTPEEVLRLASIVEWETHDASDMARVAGVYLNRLRMGWPLQADPTVQYIVLASEGRKRRLLFQDYKLDHPYNTYLRRGLPPGPLNTPSGSSIKAVLQAEHHEYFFFVSNGDGTHTFSRTLREHNRAANTYRRMMRQRRREQAGQ